MTSAAQPTPARQHQVLAVEPTRQAAATRQRANDVQVVQGNSAEAIFRYLHGDMFSAEIMKSASAL